MSRRALTLLLVLLLIPAASAGDATDPELVDPESDATASPGQCKVGSNNADAAACTGALGPGEAAATQKADITAVWVADVNATHYGVYVATMAAGDADTTIALSFKVMRTEHSLPGGSDNQTVSVTVTGTTLDAAAPANTTAARNATDDKIMEILFTRADTGAVGGDAIQNITVTATDKQTVTGDPVSQLNREDTTTDSTEGDSRPYNLTRPAKMGNLTMVVHGGELTQTLNGTAAMTTFNGGHVALNQSANGTATVRYDLTVTNHGLDPDQVVFQVYDAAGLAGRGINATITPGTATLAPGESVALVMAVRLDNATGGNQTVFAQATSGYGGFAVGATSIVVPAPLPPAPGPEPEPEPTPTDDERTLAVAGLGFLTPVAEAMGLIEPFGEYAEVVVLAIILLLLVLVIFLIIFLATRGTIRVRIEPRKMVVAPGQTAEFRVEIKNKRGREVDAVTSFEGDPAWQTTLSFSGHDMSEPGADAAMHLGGKKEQSSVRHGVLKVTAPEAADDESDRVTINVAPLRDDGSRRKPQRTEVRVQAQAGAAPGGIRLAGVDHDPSHPEAGQVVETTARIENDSEDETQHLRVVLNVDGDDLQEQAVTLPPQQARAVVFSWRVPEGSSKVRVRIYADE